MTRAPISPIIKKVSVRHPLYSWSHKLHMCVDNFVWVHVGQLDGLPDLALQALGPSPGHRELDGLGVPGVLWVLPGQVRGHAVGGHIAQYLRVVPPVSILKMY